VRAGRIAAIAVAFALTLCAGIWLGGHPSHLPSFIRSRLVGASTGLNAEVSELIQDNYYRPVGETELGDASLQGMVRALRGRYHDPFSEYFSPKSLVGFNEEINGHFSGVGIVIVPTKRGIRAEQVLHGTPAEKAGIKPGDTIVSVNGRQLAGKSTEVARELITGPEGTSVSLGILRPGRRGVKTIEVTRAEITTPVTFTKIKRVEGHKLGYVRFARFTEDSDRLVAAALRRVEREGAQGVVLDLRGNPGGLLQEAVLIASLFLPKGQVVVSTNSRTQGQMVYKTVGGNLPKRPVVVLIDRGTASSAEILTAALADDAGSTVVGTRSYGKGVFQQDFGLSNGGALKLTVGQYFTPDGINLAGKGIHPNVYVRDNPKSLRDEAMQRALEVLAHQVNG